MARDITETGSGIKLLSTIASAEPLPTATWLGSIKKNMDAEVIRVLKVIMTMSQML